MMSMALCVTATDNAETPVAIDLSKYMPQFHGVMRARFDQLVDRDGEGRFQVANARVNMRGNVTDFASYFMQVDFCSKGAVKILDAYLTLKSRHGWKIMAGQMRVPFSVDASKVIEDYLFTHRSFIGKYVGNFRAVGVKAGWNAKFMPVYVEGGVFNSDAMTSHEGWQKDYIYAVKTRLSLGNCFVEGAFESRCPDRIRINMTDAAFCWSTERWTAEAEYIYKHYTNSSAKACHVFNVMADYRMPIDTEWFNQMSFQGRYDGAGDHCSGSRHEGELAVENPSRQRATCGVTLSRLNEKTGLDLRLNYDQYFFKNRSLTTSNDGSRVSVELIVWF